MGIESPINFTSPDGKIEKPRTLREYITATKTQVNKQNERINSSGDTGNLSARTLELGDEASRLDAFVEWKGAEVLDQPIGVAIEGFEEFIREHNAEHKKKFSGKNINTLSLDDQVDAGDLSRAADILEKIVSRMTKFEQGQLYK